MAHEYFFEHHRLEAKRNARRLRVILVMLAMVAVGVPALLTRAATSTTADFDGVKILNSGGGTYGGSTTGPFATAIVTVKRVSTGTSTTKTVNPFWFGELAAPAAGEHYLVSISPTTIGGYRLKGLTWCMDACTGWDPQTHNFRAVSSTDFTFYANHSYHMRWIYEPVPAATPAPTPAPTPVPATPAPTPRPTAKAAVATPKPAAKVAVAATPAPGVGAAAPTPVPVPNDTAAPSVPGDFQALASGTNALVNLRWTAATDANTVTYHLERSLDQVTWTVVGAAIPELAFTDETVAFGVRYYYRLSAVDVAGNASAYVTTNARTGNFEANSNTSDVGNFISTDEIAAVEVPAGTFATNAKCTVELSAARLATDGRTAVAGPYSLVCKNVAGDVLDTYNKPVNWSFALKTKLKGSPKLVVVSQDSSGSIADVKSAAYDSKTHTMRFSQATATTTAVLAVKAGAGISPSFIAIFLLVILLIVGVIILMLRKNQRQNYNDYLRSKYYNL